MTETSKQTAQQIAGDISNRRGLGDEWDMLDDEVQSQIIEVWAGLIDATIEAAINAAREGK